MPTAIACGDRGKPRCSSRQGSVRRFRIPFNPSGSFQLVLSHAGHAEVTVFAPDGRRVRELLSRPLEAGTHRLTWDGRDDAGRPVASGVYLVRLTAGATVQTRRVALLK
jgi:hypothetical protein